MVLWCMYATDMDVNVNGEAMKIDKNATDYKDTHLFKAMYSFFFSMKLAGLYHVRTCSKQGTDWRVTPSLVYAVCILLLILVQVINIGTKIHTGDSFGAALIMKLVMLAWYMLCFLNGLACFRASFYYKALPEFFLEWTEVHPEETCLKFTKLKCIIYVTACWLFIVANLGFFAYNIFYTSVFDGLLIGVTLSHPQAYIMKIVFIIGNIFLSSAWVFPVALAMLICNILHFEFSKFNDDLQEAVSNTKVGSELDIESFRQRHQKLCQLIGHADDVLSLYIASNYICSIIDLCLVLYNLLYYPAFFEDTVTFIMSIFWLLLSSFTYAVNCFGPAYVNAVVSKHYIIYSIFSYMIKKIKCVQDHS